MQEVVSKKQKGTEVRRPAAQAGRLRARARWEGQLRRGPLLERSPPRHSETQQARQLSQLPMKLHQPATGTRGITCLHYLRTVCGQPSSGPRPATQRRTPPGLPPLSPNPLPSRPAASPHNSEAPWSPTQTSTNRQHTPLLTQALSNQITHPSMVSKGVFAIKKKKKSSVHLI